MIHILIINWNGKSNTTPCIKSVLKSNFKDFQIHLLDNNSKKNELNDIKKIFKNEPRIHYSRSKKNLGFAGGNNYLLKKIIPPVHRNEKAHKDDLVLFLNNDTKIPPDLLTKLSKALKNANTTPAALTNHEMIAVRTMRLPAKNHIDNLGIVMPRSGIARNRKTIKEPLFCPSGNCAAFTVNCLKKIHAKTGHYFDPLYFCYAEDVDLAWRAQLLGFKTKYLDDAICYHKGGATTGGDFNKFIMYHTLRNNLYNLVKNAPTSLILKRLPHILAFRIALFFRYLPTKKFPTLLRVHKDFIKTLPKLLKKRRLIQKSAIKPKKDPTEGHPCGTKKEAIS